MGAVFLCKLRAIRESPLRYTVGFCVIWRDDERHRPLLPPPLVLTVNQLRRGQAPTLRGFAVGLYVLLRAIRESPLRVAYDYLFSFFNYSFFIIHFSLVKRVSSPTS